MDRGDLAMLLVVTIAVLVSLFIIVNHNARIADMEQRIERCEGGK